MSISLQPSLDLTEVSDYQQGNRQEEDAHVYVDDPGQWMLGVGAALDGDAQYGLGLLHGDSQVALMIGHHQGAIFFAALRHLAAGQPLHAVVSPWRATPGGPTTGGPAAGPTLLEQLRLLHVEASRELVREFLERAQLAFERRQSSTGSSIRPFRRIRASDSSSEFRRRRGRNNRYAAIIDAKPLRRVNSRDSLANETVTSVIRDLGFAFDYLIDSDRFETLYR